MQRTLLIGTYTDAGGRGIYAVPFDDATGELATPTLAAAMESPSWIALAPKGRSLYAVSESANRLHAFRLGARGRLTPLNTRPAGGGAPCHVVIDPTQRAAFVSNYTGGSVATFALQPDGRLGASTGVMQHTGAGANKERQEKPHAHGVTLTADNKVAFAADLGIDKVVAYDVNAARAALTLRSSATVSLPPGSGPRHTAFSPDGRQLYVANELTNTVAVFTHDPATHTLVQRQIISTLPPGYAEASSLAEVVVHPNGRFVYVSNRGHDSIVVFERVSDTGELMQRQFVPTGGKGPRHFTLSPDARWAIVANQRSDSLCVFRADASTGRLTPTEHQGTVSRPVCVIFAPER